MFYVADMRKQRKMGHITIVGPSMGNVEKFLDSMLNDEISDSQSAGSSNSFVIMLLIMKLFFWSGL